MALSLDNETRRALKKQAHHLKPVVQSGAAGLSAPVLAEIDRALTDHELVKIKLATDDKAARRKEIDTTCDDLDAACIQHIGRTATLYRPNPEDKTKPAAKSRNSPQMPANKRK